MSDKPTAVPRWADVGAEIIEPPSGRKDIGYTSAQRPPAQYDNWLLNLIYQWLLWIFNGYFTRNDLTDRTPVVAFTDTAGNERTYVDSMGYFMGPAVQNLYKGVMGNDVAASTADAKVFEDLHGTTGANCTVDINNTTTFSTNFALISLTVGAAAASSAVALHQAGDILFDDLDNASIALEFDMRYDPGSTVNDNIHIQMGFHEDPDALGSSGTFEDGTTHAMVMYHMDTATGTNWRYVVGDGIAETTTVGPAITASTWETWRIEYHGKNTPVGVDAGFAVARFYHKGVFVAEIANANVPQTAEPIGLVLRARANATGPTATDGIHFSPIRLAYNTFLTPTVPA
jgi:hypothetical protein